MKTILLTGGGTAGHVSGNLALIPKLKTFFDKIVYVGGNGIEKELLKNYAFVEYYEIPTTKLERKFTLKNLAIPFVLLKSFVCCKKIFKKTKPNLVFSKGGYVSVVPVFCAYLKKIPAICHESDFSLGLANKIVKNKAKLVCTTFETTAKKLKNGLWTGPILNPNIFNGNKQKVLKELNISTTLPILLIMGGSLGASFLNNLVFENLDFLCEHFFVLHLTGKGKTRKIAHKNYLQFEFCGKVEKLLWITDFAITRGGSNAIFEFLALKIPMLIVPLSKKISRGDQIENANWFKNNGFAKVLLEEESFDFKQKVLEMLSEKQKTLEKMNNFKKIDAQSIIFEKIKDYLKN